MKPSSGITPLSRISSTLNPNNKVMKDILVHYTSQEKGMKILGFTLMLYTRDISNIGTVVQVIKWP